MANLHTGIQVMKLYVKCLQFTITSNHYIDYYTFCADFCLQDNIFIFFKVASTELKKNIFSCLFWSRVQMDPVSIIFLNCKIRHFFYYYRQDLPEGQLCRYFVYSRADFGVFRPAGATRCTDQGQIWQGGADAHPAGIAVTRSSHCFCF